MDSKLQRGCILGSVLAVVILLFLVILINKNQDNGKNRKVQSIQQTEEETEATPEGQIGDNLKGFLEDASFFDKEEAQSPGKNLKKLSLVVTSVEKDLRIQVVDAQGRIVTGELFQIEVQDKGTFVDENRDGVIYVTGLSSGEYQVSLGEISDYHVKEAQTRAKVKDKVEYYPITDISLLMKTEEEVVAENEDTRVSEAEGEGDETEFTDAGEKSPNGIVGIDVSKWNGEIDWEQVADTEVKFAIIRAGYRGSKTGALVVDPRFEDNMMGAGHEGLYRGVYFFTQAVNEVEAVEEASMVLELLKPYSIQYPVFIDTEGAGGNGRADGLSREERTKVCEAFCKTIENGGYEAGVYASRNWFNHKVEASRLEQYHIWLAEYRQEPLYEGYYEIWQHTSKGQVPGIEGNVDKNISYYEIDENR